MAEPLRLGAVVPATGAEGPGRRFALWVRGCSLRCPGCFNPHLWTRRGGDEVATGDLLARVLAARDEHGVEGITLLGGEPFEQAPASARLAAAVRAEGLSVMTFTGYDRDELSGPGAPAGAADLIAHTDLLVTGRYLRDRPDRRRPWVGSTNQRFVFLTDRYRHLERELESLPDRVEVRVAPDGTVRVTGWAPTALLEDLLSDDALPLRRAPRR